MILFATDLIDEGFPLVLDRLRNEALMDGVTVAGNYHHSRDVFPHNPVAKVRFFQGEVYFRPDAARYGDIKPPTSPVVDSGDPLDTLIEQARARELEVRVWTNNTHNSRIGQAHPQSTVENCFGDRMVYALCPAKPEVRAYIRALSGDIASRPVQALQLETPGFLPFDHGWHHERSYVPLSPVVKFVLGLCFCSSCRHAARREGVDPDALRVWAAAAVERAFDARTSELDGVPLERDAVGALAGGALDGMVRARMATVTTLCQEVVSEAGGVPVIFMDMSGGLRAAGSGMNVASTSDPAPARAWQDGSDLASLGRVCDGVSMLGYSADPQAIVADLKAYRSLVPIERLSAVLRPMAPDCTSPEDLAKKIALIKRAGVDWLYLYHYGFMPLANLGWIRRALSGAAAARA